MKKLIGVGALVALFGGCSAAYQYGTQDVLTASVNSKERVCDGGENGSCKWMVLTDKMSFVNEDALFHLKFSSTDLQSSIREGVEYEFEHYGWRIPFLSVYPNITAVKEINQ